MSDHEPAPSAGLVALGTALLDDRADGARAVLVLPAGSDVATRLAVHIGAARVFTHPPAPPVWQNGDLPTALGVADRDVEAQRPGLWPAGRLPARYRIRRVDTLYAGQPVGLLVLADPDTAADVLAGSAGIVATCRPAVLLDLRDAPATQADHVCDAVIARLPGYAWVAGAGATPCALPSGMVARNLAELVRISAATVGTVFDDRLVCGGLHVPEADAPGRGRWTGATYDTWFMLPRPAAGAWMLRLDVSDWGNAGAGFASVIEGRRLSPARMDAEGAEYGPFTLRQAAGAVVRVDLLTPHAVPDRECWPRRIGLRIRAAWLSRVE